MTATHDARPIDVREIDGSSLRCDNTKPFGDIRPVPGVNTGEFEENPSLSPDELTIYFASNRQSPGTADGDIYVATRANRDDAFGTAAPVASVNTGADERSPSISSDGLSLFFHSSRGTSYDIYVSTRANTAAPFGAPTALATDIDSTAVETSPAVTPDGQTLYFDRTPSAAPSEIWRATLGATGFGTPTLVSELATGGDSFDAAPSADGLTMFFSSSRSGGLGSGDIWVATRASTSVGFDPPANLAELSTAAEDRAGSLSADGCRFYFWSARSGGTGGFDLWQATRPR